MIDEIGRGIQIGGLRRADLGSRNTELSGLKLALGALSSGNARVLPPPNLKSSSWCTTTIINEVTYHGQSGSDQKKKIQTEQNIIKLQQH